MEYTHLDNTVEIMDVYKFFPRLGKDLMAAFEMPLNLLFPTLIRNNIGHVNKVNMKNIEAFRKSFQDFLDITTDEESCYRMIQREHPDYKAIDLFNDLQGFLFDGYETLAEVFCTTIYFLNKNPEMYKKACADIREAGISPQKNIDEIIEYEKVRDLDYLTMCIKESLRIDPPLARSMHFYAKEDLIIAGVPLPKGSLMSMCFIARHYDPKVWQKPTEYIPERFDPESEYYFVPGEKKVRPQISFVPFSNAIRRCPAPTFAYLELKVFLAYFLSRFEYKVDQKLLDSDDIRYGILSQFPLNVTITKKLC